jgi:hypothetical protein
MGAWNYANETWARVTRSEGDMFEPRGAASQGANSGGDTVDVLWRSQAQPLPTM